jgi:hypothetical protein
MLHYQSRRHQRLMDESEQALRDAASRIPARESRIARETLDDPRMYRMWEDTHAELVRPVAAHSRRARQLFELRELDVQLVHKRALIEHIRRHQLIGNDRVRMLAAFYGPKDTRDAILVEHRKYTLAVSSEVSANHLIRVMSDPVGMKLIAKYETLYTKYFDLYGFVVLADDAVWSDALKPMMQELRQQSMHLRRRIHSEAPGNSIANFDRQALLARSGRYPVLDYMAR